jgi:membrane protease YdiL (CAAX protease family)
MYSDLRKMNIPTTDYSPEATLVDPSNPTTINNPEESKCKTIFCTHILRRGSKPAYEFDNQFVAKTPRHIAAVVLIALLPTIFIISLLVVARMGVLAMFLFHWVGAIGAPCLYMVLMKDTHGPIKYVASQFTGYAVQSKQWITAFLIFIVLTGIGFAFVVLISKWCWLASDFYAPVKGNVENNAGIVFSTEGAVLFVLYFTFINSLIEELFFRGWLLERLGSTLKKEVLGCFFYAFYHFFVMFAVFPKQIEFYIWGSILLTLGLMLAGFVLSKIHRIHGIIMSWSVHAVADACIMFGLLAVYYQPWSDPSCDDVVVNNVTSPSSV